MSQDASTPLMRQYNAIKQQVPDALLMFRLGDFYELFFEDAVTAARELEITLTSRNKEKGRRHPDVRRALPCRRRLRRAPDSERLPRRHLRSDGRPAARQETGEARDHPHRHSGHRYRTQLLRSHENNYLAARGARGQSRGHRARGHLHRRVPRHRSGRGRRSMRRSNSLARARC